MEATTCQDFTRANYRRLLRLAKSSYRFCRYPEAESAEGFVLWRHDVDMSVHAGAKLARIEAEEQVVATYFLHAQSKYYNLFEPEVGGLVRAILSLGHDLGIHLELGCHGVENEKQLERALAVERRWLHDLFGVEIRAFSFHDPGRLALSFKRYQYCGLVNAYAETFQTRVGYCSDSNGVWRHRRLEEVLLARQEPRLQVLTHPEWWTEEPMMPRQRVHRCIDGRAQRLKEYYDRKLREAGRPNQGAPGGPEQSPP